MLCASCFKGKLWRLYTKGQHRFEKRLDVLKLVTQLGHMKVITRKLIERGIVKVHELASNEESILRIDSSDEDEIKDFDTEL